MTPPCVSSHLNHPDSLSLTICIPPALQKYKTKRWGTTILSLYSHFLHGEQKIFLPFSPPPTTPYSYLGILSSFPNTLYYYFYYIFASCLNFFLARCKKLLLAIVVLKRSWSLCSKWKNPSRTRGWGEGEQLY
jgi:hypothetical protein